MCTSVIFFRKGHAWPLIIGSNRDEKLSRKSDFPGRHWPVDHPHVIGGFDFKEKGSWIAINDYGLVAIIHNRKLEEDNNIKKESRGHIILKLLNFEIIDDAHKYLQNINQSLYDGFNIILGNQSHCFWGKHISVNKKIEVKELNEGISMLTDKDLNDLNDKKINYYVNKFSQTPMPDPSKNDWLAWELLLSMEKIDNQNYPEEAICFINNNNNYGTCSSSLIAIPENYSIKQFKNPTIFRSTKHSPIKSSFIDVDFDC